MLANERRDIIKQILDKEKTITVKVLAQKLSVTMETIRSDLDYLSKQNLGIKKVHGGAYKIDTFDKSIPIQLREQVMIKEKEILAKIAIQYIHDGDVIMLDSSSTSFCIANLLISNNIKSTVITNSLSIMNIVSNSPHLKLISLGGTLVHSSNAFKGGTTLLNLSNIHADKAFISPTAISIDFGLSHDNEPAALITEKMIKNSSSIFLIVDHTKFGKACLTKISNFNTIDYVISNKKPNKEWIDFFNQNDIICKY